MPSTAELEDRRIVWPSDALPCPLDRVLRQAYRGAPWTLCRRLVQTGKVMLRGSVVLEPGTMVGPNDEINVHPRAARPGRRHAEPVRLVHVDSQVVVADKPSGISTVPFDSSERDSFDERVLRELSKRSGRRLPPLGIVHRIDKETSGLVVFARTTLAKRHLKQQFRFHTNHRAYLALVQGTIQSRTITSRLIEDRGDGRRGSVRGNAPIGQLATTHVEVVERFSGVTLVRCRLETGRTHQIRIHLAEAGHPLLGERVYGPRQSREKPETARLMLHAVELGFTHPSLGTWLTFSSEPPAEFLNELEKLRRT